MPSAQKSTPFKCANGVLTMQDNPYASVPEDMAVTAAAATFVETVTFEDVPEDAIHVGT